MKSADNKSEHFFHRSKYYLVLIVIIISVLLWNYWKIYFLERKMEKEKIGIITSYEMRLDSLNAVQMQLTAKTFSWAIRSELLRGNKDQINQYFNEFIKTNGIVKLQLITTENSRVEISTDKKDEGTQNVDYINIKDQKVISGLPQLRIATPISNMNKQIAVFILEANK